MRIDTAVLEQQLDRRLVGSPAGRATQRAARQVALQAQQFGTRLRHVDVQRIELLHRRQRGLLVGGDQSAGGHCRGVDAAGDRRGDARAGQLDARRIERGARHAEIGPCLLQRRLAVIVELLADRLDLRQLDVAPRRHLGRTQRGLGLGDAGLRAGVDGLVARRVELVQRLPGAHLRTLLEQPALHDAADLRADLGDQPRRGAPGQFGGDRLALCCDNVDTDFDRPAWGRCGRLLGAARQQQRDPQQGSRVAHQGTWTIGGGRAGRSDVHAAGLKGNSARMP